MNRTWIVRALLIAAMLLLAAGCRKKPAGDNISGSSGTSGQWSGFSSSPGPILVGHTVKLSDMTPSEQKFGIAPKRGPGVEYQPDVILMEHGDQAIRAASSNGLSWTFDANAPQVSDFQVGKIVFATGRAVGKVLALERNGNDVSVLLGPVQLTDLVKRGKFSYHQPLDLSQAIAYVSPDYPGAPDSPLMQNPLPGAQASLRGGSSKWHIGQYYVVSDDGQWTPMTTVRQSGSSRSAKPRLLRSNFVMQGAAVPNVPLTPPALPDTPSLKAPSVPYPGNLGNFKPSDIPYTFPQLPMIPFTHMQVGACPNCGGLGIRMYQEEKGVKVWVSVVFQLNHPEVLFDAEIADGGIKANLQFKGGAGVKVTLDAASQPDFQGNIKEVGLIPIDVTIPIGVIVPLSIDLSQSIDLESAFSAKTSTLHGEGSIGLDGVIYAEYNNGWNIHKPQAVLKNNLAGMVSGISVGINSMVFAVNQRVLVGVGHLGFAAGPYVDLISSMTSLKGSSIATTLLSRAPICAQGTFQMTLGAGIGYSMPKVVAKVINTILGWFGAKPIQSTGSIIALPHRVDMVDHRDEIPEGCSGSS
jgi:hypothetical protein